jgi:phosphoribosyl-dephospho-CoA transferase
MTDVLAASANASALRKPWVPPTRWRAHDLLRVRALADVEACAPCIALVPDAPDAPCVDLAPALAARVPFVDLAPASAARAPCVDLAPQALPDWTFDAFSIAPYVVVRRAQSVAGMIPVGIRGATRSERQAALLRESGVLDCVTPEQLATASPSGERAALPAFAALAAVRALLQRHGVTWGPTGSAGFELATGMPSVTATSDLDLVLRIDEPLTPASAAVLWDELMSLAAACGTRIDVQVDTPAGGFSLAEYAAGKPRVLLRTNEGPRRVADPWCAPSSARVP